MRYALLVTLAAAGLLVGCGAKKTERPGTIAGAPAQAPDISQAVVLLEKGEWKKARKLLVKQMAKAPGNLEAAKLLRQIDGDPKVLLGTSNFAYKARSGDSYRSLARRYLGDEMMFYGLARYNGVSKPDELQPGAMLRIPGTIAVAEPKPAIAKPERPGRTVQKPPVGSASAKSAAPRAQSSTALASALRRQGLSALQRGRPAVAVGYLERAAAADPANRLVAADLARARRVRDALGR
jgi:hypothetical protein